MLIEMQPAYLLHSRPFRDTSLILDFLTPDFGRLSAISRGGRSATSRSKSLLQPFTPVTISLSGKNDLKTLRAVELRTPGVPLKGERLFSALYLNEIISRLFQSHESDPGFFQEYENTLIQLGDMDLHTEPVLRNFELNLLDTLGYGIEFGVEGNTHLPLEAKQWYYFQEETGFIRLHSINGNKGVVGEEVGKTSDKHCFAGEELLKIAERDFTLPEVRKTAKIVLRTILNTHLGDRPLRSRSLFKKGV